MGANLGERTNRVLAVTEHVGKSAKVFAFEPCSATRKLLQERTLSATSVVVVLLALTDRQCDSRFFSSGAGADTNSLDPVSGPEEERYINMDLLKEQKKAAMKLAA